MDMHGNEATPKHEWYRPMRRSDRELPRDEALALVDSAEYGVLALAWPDGRPYALPINHGRDGDVVYMHCATTGQKLDMIALNPHGAFCVSEMVELVAGHSPCDASVRFRSTMLFGKVRLVTEPTEKLHGLTVICHALGIDVPPSGPGQDSLAQRMAGTAVIALDIEHVSGKSRR
jgi:nitroimidazol reductase NimA-like FMN-containing flavoprotein (pyridoxamine 5'-phosphate oxidase superfamily)